MRRRPAPSAAPEELPEIRDEAAFRAALERHLVRLAQVEMFTRRSFVCDDDGGRARLSLQAKWQGADARAFSRLLQRMAWYLDAEAPRDMARRLQRLYALRGQHIPETAIMGMLRRKGPGGQTYGKRLEQVVGRLEYAGATGQGFAWNRRGARALKALVEELLDQVYRRVPEEVALVEGEIATERATRIRG